MIRAKLIVGGRQSERLKFAHQFIKSRLGALVHPDLLVVDGGLSVSINQIRAVKKQVALKPYSASVKITLIAEAEKMTLPAQNALLKTLEEPPGETIILLLAARKESLLPTVISRCQLINLPEKPEIEIDQSAISDQLSAIDSILQARVGERLMVAENHSQNRQQAIDFCQKQLVVLREVLRGRKILSPRLTSRQIVNLLRQVHRAITLLEANVNPRLTIANLLASYPTIPR